MCGSVCVCLNLIVEGFLKLCVRSDLVNKDLLSFKVYTVDVLVLVLLHVGLPQVCYCLTRDNKP